MAYLADKCQELLVNLDNVFDLGERHQASIGIFTEDFEIVVGEDVELLYQDNCAITKYEAKARIVLNTVAFLK